MVEGLTYDTDLVLEGDQVDDDGDGDNGDNPNPNPGDPKLPGSTGGDLGQVMSTLNGNGRSEYDIERMGDDPLGQPTSVKYKSGGEVDYGYDKEGNLISVNDTKSGTTMERTDDGWKLTDKNGNTTTFKGDVSVDPETGALVTKLDNGTTITTQPDGRTTAVDEQGNLVGVSNPNYRVGDKNQYAVQPSGGHADYDDSGNMVAATDNHGNQYTLSSDGKWLVTDPNGRTTVVDGTVKIDEYRGVYVAPSSNGTQHSSAQQAAK